MEKGCGNILMVEGNFFLLPSLFDLYECQFSCDFLQVPRWMESRTTRRSGRDHYLFAGNDFVGYVLRLSQSFSLACHTNCDVDRVFRGKFASRYWYN